MSKVLIWDAPTRMFHWLLAAGFFACFGIAQFAGEHSAWFPMHMILGLALGLVALLRVVWGLVGSRYARLSSLLYTPSELAAYLKGALTATSPRYAGHNPGSAYATIAILALILVVVATGLLMSQGIEAAKELHEVATYALTAIVGIHIVGVAWHSWRRHENLTAAMVTGRKEASPADSIASPRPFAAVLFAVLIVVMTGGLLRNYDRNLGQTRVPFLGTAIPLGEVEE
jgi:cytochrome b